jgi:hypothetical protein
MMTASQRHENGSGQRWVVSATFYLFVLSPKGLRDGKLRESPVRLVGRPVKTACVSLFADGVFRFENHSGQTLAPSPRVSSLSITPPSFQSTDRRAKQAHDLLEGCAFLRRHALRLLRQHQTDLIERHFH